MTTLNHVVNLGVDCYIIIINCIFRLLDDPVYFAAAMTLGGGKRESGYHL